MTNKQVIDYIKQACLQYGIDTNSLSPIGSIENYVYTCRIGDSEYVLRAGTGDHMHHNHVKAEMEWLSYLSQKAVPAIKPVLSGNGNLVEKITADEGYLNIVVFEKAIGHHLEHGDPREWDTGFIKNWGEILGRMHALTKKYIPGETKRYNFFIPPDLIKKLLPREDKEVVERVTEITGDIAKLPKSADSYGLIHSDLHIHNFMVDDNNRITALLDFDRCCYKWFIADVAVALYYPLYMTSGMVDNNKAQKEFIDLFLPVFWEGYEQENKLDRLWKEKIADFITLRDAVLLMYMPRDERFQKGINDIRDRIMGKKSYVDIN